MKEITPILSRTEREWEQLIKRYHAIELKTAPFDMKDCADQHIAFRTLFRGMIYSPKDENGNRKLREVVRWQE